MQPLVTKIEMQTLVTHHQLQKKKNNLRQDWLPSLHQKKYFTKMHVITGNVWWVSSAKKN